MHLTTEEYKAMTSDLRKTIGLHLTNKLISATQQAFGSVDNVVEYYAKGLVIFASGERWIFNWNNLYPRFYRVDSESHGEYIIIENKKA